MKTVLETYPPAQYPKLYTGSIENHQKTQQTYLLLNRMLQTVGFSMLAAIVMWDYKTEDLISPMIPWAYFMLQMIPMMWLELKECKYFKTMRNNNRTTKKVATFTPRKLFDFLSPKLLAIAIVFMLFAFGLVIVRYGLSSKSFSNIAIIVASNLFFAGIIYWNIYGKKQDPYQAGADRLKLIKVTVTSLVYVSIGVSIFLAVNLLIKIYDLKFLNTSVMSIYCQLILLASVGNRLKQLKLEDIDFSVYKDNSEKLIHKDK
jgi:hypothetical protein